MPTMETLDIVEALFAVIHMGNVSYFCCCLRDLLNCLLIAKILQHEKSQAVLGMCSDTATC